MRFTVNYTKNDVMATINKNTIQKLVDSMSSNTNHRTVNWRRYGKRLTHNYTVGGVSIKNIDGTDEWLISGSNFDLFRLVEHYDSPNLKTTAKNVINKIMDKAVKENLAKVTLHSMKSYKLKDLVKPEHKVGDILVELCSSGYTHSFTRFLRIDRVSGSNYFYSVLGSENVETVYNIDGMDWKYKYLTNPTDTVKDSGRRMSIKTGNRMTAFDKNNKETWGYNANRAYWD